jgi:hypothetical protein
MNSLPIEMYSEILLLLNADSIKSISCTNKQINNIINDKFYHEYIVFNKYYLFGKYNVATLSWKEHFFILNKTFNISGIIKDEKNINNKKIRYHSLKEISNSLNQINIFDKKYRVSVNMFDKSPTILYNIRNIISKSIDFIIIDGYSNNMIFNMIISDNISTIRSYTGSKFIFHSKKYDKFVDICEYKCNNYYIFDKIKSIWVVLK